MKTSPVDAYYRPVRDRWFLAAALTAGAAGCAIYLAIALHHGPDGHAAIVQPDTLIFQQYARAMAEGRPYQFNAGEPPSTGSTSHLYPAVLAVFYWLGARGDALATAAFAFNIACFMAFLALFWIAARRIEPAAAPLATMLAALSGHATLAALGQTDMGLFMALSMAAMASALHRKPIALALALTLCSWCRPEGLILSGAVLAAAAAPWWSERAGPRRGVAIAAAAGIAGFGLVLALNFMLTGTTTFHSVIAKGLPRYFPPAGIAAEAARSLGALVREVIFGLTETTRRLYMLPMVAGALGAIGLMARNWRRGETARIEAAWLTAGAGAIGLVAMSGWEGIQYDRYLAWLLPVGLIYVAIGARELADRIEWRGVYPALAVLLLGYQAAGWATFASIFAGAAARTSANVAFVRSAGGDLPDGSRVGVISRSGLLYAMPPGVSVTNVRGIVSPAFAHPHDPLRNIESLKHRPELRFDAWLLPADLARGQWYSPMVGEAIALELPALGAADALGFYRADWATLEGAAEPHFDATCEELAGWRRVDALDVGYAADEARAGYTAFTRVPGARLHPFAATGWLAGREINEVGRVVLGSETFTVRTEPGQPLRIILRTAPSASAHIYKPGLGIEEQEFSFVSPLGLILIVDGGEAVPVRIDIEAGEGQFAEVVIDLPASLIQRERTELTIGGDHIALAYWFYQP